VAIRPSNAWHLRPGLFLLRKVSLRLRGSPQGQSHHGSIDASDRGETVHVLVRPPAEGDPPACRDMVEERGPHRADPPVAVLARERHGSMRAVAIMLDTPEATIRGYAYNTKLKRVPPATARRIVTLVLAHRKHPRALDIWEEQPGLRPFVALQLRRKRS